ncbi:LuxR C-terminal-related transcriptional regulator [Actinoplanes sp. NPDC020271]|uniref:helix-turn-helix transcriptional regulator n=1 Tax=Actinoplanes sp. NPDC020271 TaxID=3363896 RepID=UPI0037B85240
MLLFDRLNRASGRGHGAALLISGAVGTGKTALLQAMASRAGRQGGRCFVVTGSDWERGHPFGVLGRLIQAMCASGMDQPFPHGIDGSENFYAMMDRVCAAIRNLAGGRPILIGIDDVHFADEQSMRSLSYLIRRIDSCSAVVVLSESPSYERDMASLRAEMLHLSFCHRARLTPLAPSDIADQLREGFEGPPDRAFAQFCAEVSGGVPLLVRALFDDRAAETGPAAGEPGAGFRQAVLRSLHRCAPSTAAVARALAVLGEHAAPELTAELSGVDIALVEEGVRDLREMGLLEGERFRHPQTRSAVLASIPLPALPVVHSRAAELLHENGAPADAAAKQLIAARDGGKAPWRVAVLCEAARDAMAAGDIDSAVSDLRHAVGASADAEQRARAGALLTETQWHADPSWAARRLAKVCRDARAGLLSGSDILIAVNQLLWWGEFAEADEMLRLAGVEEGGGSALARLWAFFCRAGLAPGPGDDPGQQPDLPLADSGPIAAATYLCAVASLAFDGVPTHRVDQALLGLRAGAPLTPAFHALVVLVQTGRLDEAVAWCDRLLKADWINQVPMRKAMIGIVKSVTLSRDGNSAAALNCIEQVFEAIPPPAWGVVAGLPLSAAIRASTDLGDAHAARSYLAVPVPPAMLDTPFALPYLQALGQYHLAMGHPESAVMHTRSGVDLVTRWNGDVAGAAASLDGLSWLPGTVSEPAGARRLFDAHAQIRRTSPAASASSGNDRRHPDNGRARAATEDGARLTDAERRVAALAAAGNTNRQVAARLFITVSTVEQHLTKIYRKLKVRSRSGLRRYWSDHPGEFSADRLDMFDAPE